MALTYKNFKVVHPDYARLASYWKRCRLLYMGGHDLLTDDEVMRVVLPPHPAEPSEQYRIRRGIAYYENIAREVIDYLTAGLSADPIVVEPEDGAEADEFYDEFYEDVSIPGGRVCSLNELAKQLVQGLFLYGRTWCKVDLPRFPAENPPTSLWEQDALGLRRAYACFVSPEHVTDWEDDEYGELSFAMTREVLAKRHDLESDRNMVTVRFCVYTRADITVYDFTYDKSKQDGPKDSDPPVIDGPIPHTFGRVPLMKFEAPEECSGLYAMSALEPLVRHHIQISNGLGYAELSGLFAPRTTFIDPGHPMDGDDTSSPESQAADRAVSQPHGTATVVQMKGQPGAGDRVEYPARDTSVFQFALESCRSIAEAARRVVHIMAVNVTNSAAALKRSAESKQQDKASTHIVLEAVGKVVRAFIGHELYPMIQRGRGDEEIEWVVKGAAEFDTSGLSEKLDDAAKWSLLNVPSPTAQKLFAMDVVRAAGGERWSEDEYETIEDELDSGFAMDAEARDAETEARRSVGEATAEDPMAETKKATDG